ncbi:MAG: hypothetical protein V7707_09480 [Motiliproteus sp.]
MQSDFNEKGKKYEMLSIAGSPYHHNLIHQDGCDLLDELMKHFTEFRGNGGEHTEIAKWVATIDCLQSFLFQSNRLKTHSEKLRSLVPPPEQMMAVSGSDALTDFESLLYHGRAVLDRLTFAIAKQTLGQECEKFPKLPKILNNYKGKGDYVGKTISVIEDGIKNVRGILIDDEGGKTGLRSLLAHSKSTGEATNHVFTIHRNDSNKAMYFDLDMHGKGVINAISLFSGYGKTLELDRFYPSWEPQCTCLTDYITEDGSGTNFTTIRTNYYSNELINIHVDRSIFINVETI